MINVTEETKTLISIWNRLNAVETDIITFQVDNELGDIEFVHEEVQDKFEEVKSYIKGFLTDRLRESINIHEITEL